MLAVRQVRKDERRYYEEVLAYSRASLLLYPYHLSDIMVEGLRVTPFQYYTSVLESIMDQERSYDSLPNFTAADCECRNINEIKIIHFNFIIILRTFLFDIKWFIGLGQPCNIFMYK